jgi:DNA replicative helicase MCM subunit Mcm2 (Cdc46/Mcm family)
VASTQGIVTNATDVKPLLTVATYLDTTTGIEVYQEITGAFARHPAAQPPARCDAYIHCHVYATGQLLSCS